ncbi:hypothetical protein CCP3SC1AL1_770020 [Gammaproteobacteria bacterium]
MAGGNGEPGAGEIRGVDGGDAGDNLFGQDPFDRPGGEVREV